LVSNDYDGHIVTENAHDNTYCLIDWLWTEQ